MAVTDNSTLKGFFNTGDKPTETNFATLVDSCINTDTTVSNATSADVNLTSVTSSHKLFLTGTFAADVLLPQADANNIGITISIFCTVATAASGTIRLGFADSGSTVIAGNIHDFSTTADQGMSIVVPASSKTIHLDSDAADHAGGAEGSEYHFHYYGANLVYLTGRGVTTDTDPALDSNVASGTGI